MTIERPRLCATVAAATTAELCRRRDAADGADLVELRLDSVVDPNVAGALQGRRCPVILTCRPVREGGWFRGSEEERRAILRDAVLSDAEYVDLEWADRLDGLVRLREGRGIVCSTHEFSGVPADLRARADAMARSGADIVKIAVAAARLSDNVALLDLVGDLRGRRHVLIAMGEAGLVSRVCAARFGSEWSYAGAGVAPGQTDLAGMLREFAFRRVTPATALYGLAGRPVAHSLSPAMHNAGFSELGADAVYVPLPAADMDDLRGFAEAFSLQGASVTAPFKEVALHLADECDPVATQVGAVNTLIWRDGRVRGSNTDVPGFLASLGVAADGSGAAGAASVVRGQRVAVLGAGGAARAVIVALQSAGAHVTVFGRDLRRARDVAAEFGVKAGARPVPAGSWDMLVNATPVGTHPGDGDTPFPEGCFDGVSVCDLVYNPPTTRLMREARQAGCRVTGGLAMLVAQAQHQQDCWVGRSADAEVLREAAVWKLSTFAGNV